MLHFTYLYLELVKYNFAIILGKKYKNIQKNTLNSISFHLQSKH